MDALSLPDRVLDIDVPDELIADGPVEADGRRRDDVRMLVARRGSSELTHARAADLPRFLDAGDVLVVNTSPTLPAAVPADDGAVVVHFSTDLGGGRWVVEVREPCHHGTRPHPIDHGQAIPLAGGATVRLAAPTPPISAMGPPGCGRPSCSPRCRCPPGWRAKADRSATAAPTRPGR